MVRVFLSISICFFVVFSTAQNTIDPSGKKQGGWIEYHKGQIKKYEGTYKDDKPIGTFTNYDNQGKLISTLNYDSLPYVKATFFHLNEKKQATGFYLKKQKEGLWKFYNTSENLIGEEQYQKGLKHGRSVLYYRSGQIAQIDTFQMGLRNGIERKFFENGKKKLEAYFEDDEHQGKYREYYSNGLPKVAGNHINALQEGKWIFYNEDGSTRLREYYIKGKREREEKVNGEFKFYYEKSPEILKEVCRYKDGLKHGPFIQFYETGGFKIGQTTIKTPEGEMPQQERYFEGEKVKQKGTYVKGKLHGEVRYFNEKGQLESVVHYKNGVVVE